MYLILYSTSNRPRTDLVGEKPCIENIDTINQPSATYAYPKREQSGGMRSFQSKWFAEFRWLHYDPETDSALYLHVCKRTNRTKWPRQRMNLHSSKMVTETGIMDRLISESMQRAILISNPVTNWLSHQHLSQGTWTKFLTPFQSRKDIITDRCYWESWRLFSF